MKKKGFAMKKGSFVILFAAMFLFTDAHAQAPGALLYLRISSGGSAHHAIFWTMPSIYNDGSPSPLSTIGGFRVYYGTEAGSYYTNIYIDVGKITSYDVAALATSNGGSLYLAITVYDTDGIESGFSNELHVVI